MRTKKIAASTTSPLTREEQLALRPFQEKPRLSPRVFSISRTIASAKHLRTHETLCDPGDVEVILIKNRLAVCTMTGYPPALIEEDDPALAAMAYVRSFYAGNQPIR